MLATNIRQQRLHGAAMLFFLFCSWSIFIYAFSATQTTLYFQNILQIHLYLIPSSWTSVLQLAFEKRHIAIGTGNTTFELSGSTIIHGSRRHSEFPQRLIQWFN
jgi:hypothetical protein